MPCAVGHAIGRAVAAEVEIGRADGADRPAAFAGGEIEQRAGLGANHIRHHGFGGEERLEREPLGEDLRPPGRRRRAGSARGGGAPATRKSEPVHLADDGIARDADFLSNLCAGETGVEIGSEYGHAFGGPGAPRIIAGDIGGHGWPRDPLERPCWAAGRARSHPRVSSR